MAVSPLKALADGMGGGAFGQRGVFQKLRVDHFAVMYSVYFKNALSKGSRFIKHHNFALGKRFKIIGTFYKYTRLAGASYTCKKAERYAYNQRAGTAYNQKGKRAVYPNAPLRLQPHCQNAY